MSSTTITIGVLALQGAFIEHIKMLQQLGVNAVEVRKAEQLATLDGLIIPGGESTTMGLIAERWGLVEPLRKWVHDGHATWGTCAGMILLANQATHQKQGGQPLLGGLDVTVDRNYFGRQVDSFETDLVVPLLGSDPFRAVFIRAPAIVAVGEGAETLMEVTTPKGDRVIAAARQGPLLATAFHPELTTDLRWHELFVQMVRDNCNSVA
ncbi:MAG: pyridoxal 5'-phosphate synthase glutaminase subunit PdxT [Caldilineaceae bacterium]|nr:pyridoxal 5'-phosphate synthase glutaminase subunit PdxT [Caldilineaceae bacterium]